MKCALLSVFFLFLCLCATAQVEIVVKSIPGHTPADAPVFLAATFNNWNPGDSAFALKKQRDGTYRITLPSEVMSFEYKFTRGNWKTVEGLANGGHRANRTCTQDGKSPLLIETTIEGWEDISKTQPGATFVVESLPSNTPHDASLYIVGSFNNWNPGDPHFVMHKFDEGKYIITLPPGMNDFEYKFTRGNWSSVEGRSNGRAIPNRVFHKKNGESMLIKVKIESWEDLSGDPINAYTFTLILAAFQGFLLILAINGIQNNNTSANRMLSIMIALISVSLLSRVSTYDRDIFQQNPGLILLPDMIFFLYAPCFYFYVRNLLTLPEKKSFGRIVHLIPFVVHLLIYTPLWLMEKQVLINHIIDRDLVLLFAGLAFAAMVYNLIYWLQCLSILKQYKRTYDNTQSLEQNLNYLNTVMVLKAVCLAVWLFTGLTFFAEYILGWNTHWLTEYSTDAIWLLFSCFTYCLGYFAINQPEIFKIKNLNPVVEVPVFSAAAEPLESPQPEQKDDILPYREKLLLLMEEKKPFLNPKLTLGELAEMMSTTTHTLSRVINEGFDMNFYDFVNGYRIEEFKKLAGQDTYRNQTLLAVALDVGFNSKTAFNRAFKKITNLTPSEYLKSVQNTSIKYEEIA